MPEQDLKRSSSWKLPVMLICGVVIVLAMVSLGVWQLDRAAQKQGIVNQLSQRSAIDSVALESLLDESSEDLRFRSVFLTGRYLAEQTILVDNQVVNGQVGYQVFSPFQVENIYQLVLVARGWVSVGASRELIPEISTSRQTIKLTGKLNKLPAKPPLWNDEYAVYKGSVWQYLPINEVSTVLNAKVFPLVLELAPESTDSSDLVRKWPAINDQWVAKHKGYAFQWFAMAIGFFIACLVLLLRKFKTVRANTP